MACSWMVARKTEARWNSWHAPKAPFPLRDREENNVRLRGALSRQEAHLGTSKMG